MVFSPVMFDQRLLKDLGRVVLDVKGGERDGGWFSERWSRVQCPGNERRRFSGTDGEARSAAL
jgi:hypothetical protein